MSALGRKVLDLAEQQGLLDGQAIAELRRQVAESKFVITPEAIAKVLVDQGHLTPYQARKLVAQALGPDPDPVERRLAEKEKKSKKQKTPASEELTLAEDDESPRSTSSSPPRGWRTDPQAAPPPSAGRQPRPDSPPTPDRPASVSPTRSQPPAPSPSKIRSPEGRNQEASSSGEDDPSTAEDFLPPPAVPARTPPRGRRWKDEPTSGLSETIEMSPEELSGGPPPHLVPEPLPAPEDLAASVAPALAVPATGGPASGWPPGGDPLALPGDMLRPVPAPVRGVRGWLPRNVWDSPLLLLGGGALGLLLVAFSLLWYALTRGTAAELLAQAEEAYRSGAYHQAIPLYDRFLQRYPRNPQASLARVRRGMAVLRQVTDAGQNPRLGLETARRVLPQLEAEPAFAETRPELALVLPELAAGLAQQAVDAGSLEQQEELVRLTRQALELVDNPSYLPASLRMSREAQLARIEDRLQLAQRRIAEATARRQAVAAMQRQAEAGQTAEAYATYAELVQTYPALAADPEVRAALRQVGRAEAGQVTVQPLERAASTDQPPGLPRPLILAPRTLLSEAEKIEGMVFVLVEGAVYGIEASSGQVRWRWFVGYETTWSPRRWTDASGEDCLLLDQRRREVIRLRGRSGQLVWRQPLDQRPIGLAGQADQLFVVTAPGQVLALEAASGRIVRQAQLPQPAGAAPVLAGGLLGVLGERATLFVLEPSSLACRQTVFLGHWPGAVLVPPCSLGDLWLVGESVRDEWSLLSILGPDAQGQLGVRGRPLRLKGRIVTPLSVSGSRVAVATDRGQLVVYERDPTAEPPLRQVAMLETATPQPQSRWTYLERNWLWTSADRPALWELRPAQDQLARRWTGAQEGDCVGPLAAVGEVVVHLRRRPGLAGVQVEAYRLVDGRALWTTTLAAPLIAASSDGTTCHLLAEDGRCYRVELPAPSTGAWVLETPVTMPPGGPTALQPPVSATPDNRTWVVTSWDGQQVFRYRLAAPEQVAVQRMDPPATTPATAWGEGVVFGQSDGTVAWRGWDAQPPDPVPFLPPWNADSPPGWGPPGVLPGGRHLAMVQASGELFVLRTQAGPPPHLAQVARRPLDGPLVGAWALCDQVAVGVVRGPQQDRVVGLDADGNEAFAWPLRGRVEWGPCAVGQAVLVAGASDGLVCLDQGGTLRWQQPLRYGPLVGPVLVGDEGDWIGMTAAGVVLRWNPEHGRELARHDVGQPLGIAAAWWGSSLAVAGSDGTLHLLPPPRP